MLKKTITYTDYDGNERTEDHYFNLSEAELAEMNLSTQGGYEKQIERIVQAQNNSELLRVFKEIIQKSYGVKSPDGKRFIKSPELFEEFSQTEAYTKLFMELIQDDNAAFAFSRGILPKNIQDKAEAMMKEKGVVVPIQSADS